MEELKEMAKMALETRAWIALAIVSIYTAQNLNKKSCFWFGLIWAIIAIAGFITVWISKKEILS